MKKKFNKKKLLTFGIIGLFSLVLVGAVLLTYYGQINQPYDVMQSVTIGGVGCNGGVCTELEVVGFSGDILVSNVYTLTNNADTPRDVLLETTYDPNEEDEITTSYYEFELEGVTETVEGGRENYGGDVVDLDDGTDAYNTLGNINLEIDYEASQAVFTITTPADMIGSTAGTYSGSVVFIVDEDADGTTDWQVSYEPGSDNWKVPNAVVEGDWGYEEALENGANPNPRAFVDVTTIDGIEVERNEDSFILKVDLDVLGGIGSDYKFGFYISVLTEYWGGLPGGAGQVMIFYPTYSEFNWADTSNYETRTIGTIGTEIDPNPFELPADSSLDFVVVNEFNDLSDGFTGTITTEALPATQ